MGNKMMRLTEKWSFEPIAPRVSRKPNKIVITGLLRAMNFITPIFLEFSNSPGKTIQ
jgi:hypothetical protein